MRAEWRFVFRKEIPKALSRDLLVRMLVWRIQEKLLGGHDAVTVQLLNAYGRGLGKHYGVTRERS